MKARMIMVEAEGEAASAAARTVAEFIGRGQALQREIDAVLAPLEPIDVIAGAIGTSRARRKAKAVLEALDAAGWRLLRR